MEHPRTTKNVGQPCVICGQPANAQATVEALQAVIRQMGEQAAVLAKDGMAAKAQVAALQRVRDEFERERDQLHAALMEAALLRDHNLRRCDVLDSKYKKGLAAVKVLQSQLSQLQALVRAFFTSEDKWAVAYRELERLGYTLDTTTPGEGGQDEQQ